MAASSAQIPSGSLAMKATSGNVANAIATATMTPDPNKLAYIVGFDVTGTGATAGLPAVVTVSGLAGGSITFTYAAVAGVLVANQALQKAFPMPLPASAPGVAIAVACAALGAGATNNVVTAYGFQDGP
jgi:hypothetical protein